MWAQYSSFSLINPIGAIDMMSFYIDIIINEYREIMLTQFYYCSKCIDYFR